MEGALMEMVTLEAKPARIRRQKKAAQATNQKPADQLKNGLVLGKQQQPKKEDQPILNSDHQEQPTTGGAARGSNVKGRGRGRARGKGRGQQDRNITSQNGSFGIMPYQLPQQPYGHSGAISLDYSPPIARQIILSMKSNTLSKQVILSIKPNSVADANDVIWHPDFVTPSHTTNNNNVCFQDSFMDSSLTFNGASEKGTEDNAGAYTPVPSIENQLEEDEEEAQNSKVSPALKTERKEDNFSCVHSVLERGEEDHERLLDFGEIESSPQFPLHNDHQALLGAKTAQRIAWCFSTATRVLWSKTNSTNAVIKWVLMVLNVFLELCQAVLAQEEAQGKMGRKGYLKLTIVTSFVCLMMSLIEAFHKGRNAGVKWQRRGHCFWFYNPGERGQLFGGYMLYFGIICSMVQLGFNLAAKFTNKDIIQFDYVPLLLSAFHLVAAVIGSGEKTGGLSATVNCRIHGPNVAEGKIGDGGEGLVFECPICHEDIP